MLSDDSEYIYPQNINNPQVVIRRIYGQHVFAFVAPTSSKMWIFYGYRFLLQIFEDQ